MAKKKRKGPSDAERVSLFFALLLERYHDLRVVADAEAKDRLEEKEHIDVKAEATVGVDAARTLLDDVITLFGLGDLDGGLISLERLLFMYPDNPRVSGFVQKYEDKILRLYEDVYAKDDVILEFGPAARGESYQYYRDVDSLMLIQGLVRDSEDGRASSIVAASPFGPLRTLALINFLTRPHLIGVRPD